MNIHNIPNSWLAPQLESRAFPEKGGHGVYALQPIPRGTLLAMFGGTVIDGNQLQNVPETLQGLSIQVDDNLFLVTPIPGVGDHLNHSCEPNAGLLGQIGIVAMRDIANGEEVTFDYAMCDSIPYDEFDCMCGEEACRGKVTGDDWKNPDLWQKYDGYFSPYLQRKIDEMRLHSDGKVHSDMRSHKI